jgi:hypothetical protein
LIPTHMLIWYILQSPFVECYRMELAYLCYKMIVLKIKLVHFSSTCEKLIITQLVYGRPAVELA